MYQGQGGGGYSLNYQCFDSGKGVGAIHAGGFAAGVQPWRNQAFEGGGGGRPTCTCIITCILYFYIYIWIYNISMADYHRPQERHHHVQAIIMIINSSRQQQQCHIHSISVSISIITIIFVLFLLPNSVRTLHSRPSLVSAQALCFLDTQPECLEDSGLRYSVHQAEVQRLSCVLMALQAQVHKTAGVDKTWKTCSCFRWDSIVQVVPWGSLGWSNNLWGGGQDGPIYMTRKLQSQECLQSSWKWKAFWFWNFARLLGGAFGFQR